MLKFHLREQRDLGIYQNKNKFSSESLKVTASIASPSGGDAYWFLVLLIMLFYVIKHTRYKIYTDILLSFYQQTQC